MVKVQFKALDTECISLFLIFLQNSYWNALLQKFLKQTNLFLYSADFMKLIWSQN